MQIYAWQVDLPSQSSIDALNTTTPNLPDLEDIAQCRYMHGRLTPRSIEHRCLEYRYTKLARSTPQRTSTYERPFTREGNYLVMLVTQCKRYEFAAKIGLH